MNILSITSEQLNKLHPNLTEEFLRDFIIQHPYVGKDEKNYFIISNGVTLVNENIEHAKIYNMFIANSRNNYQLIQVVKRKSNAEEQEQSGSQNTSN